MDIDVAKDVYLFLHGNMELKDAATKALESKGFSADKIVLASTDKTGQIGDYMAMLWMPPNPDHIKVQLITAIDPNVEPEGMTGKWKGVTKDDLFTIPL